MKKILFKGTYKPEIDGLRGFAVLAVIVNHFNKDILPSGYLGVDIFFVISGFVITSSLANRESKNFTDFICGFYERRIKRLVPPLIVFVIITSILISFFRTDSSGSLNTAITSIFGFSNIALFIKSKDYFATSTTLNPFTHTWSLGVEEQFYFIYPFLIWFSGFGKKNLKSSKNLVILLTFLAVCSSIFFIYQYLNNKPAAYFLMPSRFWEMAIGCLLFLSINRKYYIIQKLKKIPSFLIFSAIIGCMFMPITYGVLSTFLVVFLSAFIINSLSEGDIAFKILTNKAIIYLGLISYSLYLWHWGVLSISRWTIGIHWWTIPFQAIIILFISIISYKYIEKPLRRKEWSLKRINSISKGVLALIFSALTIIGLIKPFRSNLYLGNKNLLIKKPYFKFLDIGENCHNMSFEKGYNHEKVLENCFANNKKERTLYFLGDSHNWSLWPGAEYIAINTDSNLFAFSNGGKLFPSIKTIYKENKVNDIMLHEIKILENLKKGDIVFLTLRYPYYFAKKWHEDDQVVVDKLKNNYFEDWLFSLNIFIKELSEKNVKLVLSTPTPEFPEFKNKACRVHNPQWFNKYSLVDCSNNYKLSKFNTLGDEYFYIIQRLKDLESNYKNTFIFNSFEVICPEFKCKYTFEDTPLFRDDDHISNYAARYILAPKVINFLKIKKII